MQRVRPRESQKRITMEDFLKKFNRELIFMTLILLIIQPFLFLTIYDLESKNKQLEQQQDDCRRLQRSLHTQRQWEMTLFTYGLDSLSKQGYTDLILSEDYDVDEMPHEEQGYKYNAYFRGLDANGKIVAGRFSLNEEQNPASGFLIFFFELPNYKNK